VPAGQRHHAVLQRASSLRARGVPLDEAMHAMWGELWPLLDQDSHPYTEQEFKACVIDVYARYPGSGNAFSPMAMINAVYADRDLTSTQLLYLLSAIKCTDNATGEVRMSQAGLAELAHVDRETFRAALKSEAVSRYFKIERSNNGRRIHLTWLPRH
jgi:hypothetical protein